jgi:hypothetical protein
MARGWTRTAPGGKPALEFDGNVQNDTKTFCSGGKMSLKNHAKLCNLGEHDAVWARCE